MGLFGWLLGSKAKPADPRTAPSRPRIVVVEVEESFSDFLRIPELDMFGPFSRSPDGRYTLVWRDASGPRGGARDSGEGRYVLLDGRKVAAIGTMQRPNDGKVADNGTFVLNDWRFSSDLSGIFWAFRRDGSLILSRTFSANLYNNGLSADGALAACQTCNSGSEDSSVLAVFDLVTGKEISSFRPESGWAQRYEFPPGADTIRLHYANDGGAFDYSLAGAFIDREKWIAARLKGGDLYMVKHVMAEADNRPDPALAKQLIASVDIGLAHQSWRDDRSQAFGWRLRGEILESTGAFSEALDCYEKALARDPKIGLKRRVQQLRKSMAKPADR